MNKIILLDSNSLINRAFYALPPLVNKKGIYTNGVYGFIMMLLKLIEDQKPTHLCAVFDLKAPTFRHKIYADYKGTRKGMPEELIPQIPILKEVLQLFNIKVLSMEGYEADDIIGTLAKRFDDETIIVSGDRDVFQLIDESTTIFNTRRGVTDISIYDREMLKNDGLTPEQVIEYKALAGDASDNIPGCVGVGEKTAKRLIADYQDIDNIYLNIEKEKGKLKERLIEHKDTVYLSKILATINTKVPIDCELQDIAFQKRFSEELKNKFFELEFTSLLTRIGDNKSRQQRIEESNLVQISGNDDLPWNEKSESTIKDYLKDKTEALAIKTEFKTVEVDNYKRVEINDVYGIKNALKSAKQVAISMVKSDISFAVDKKTLYVINCGNSILDDFSLDEALRVLFDQCADKEKILYDAKSVMHSLFDYGILISNPYQDILLQGYLINSNNPLKNQQEIFERYGIDAKSEAVGILYLYEHLCSELTELKLDDLYYDIELPLIDVLFDMEISGFSVDVVMLDKFSNKYSLEIDDITQKIYAVAGEEFNINSTKQLGHILFNVLNLPTAKKTKMGYSVSAEVLEEIDHEIINLLLRYRKISKLQSTYIEGMRSQINSVNGKVNTIFKQCLTNTGRLSSTEPNLQNIPIRNDEGREIRKMFVPSVGNVLVTADYSQIELRLLAHFSGDKQLIEAFLKNEDIHLLTASKIFEKPLSEITLDERRSAKAVNFGIIYGISAFGLARDVGTTPSKAKMFVDKYFQTYSDIKRYIDANVDMATTVGYIRTLMGRLRFFPELASPNRNLREFGKRAAMNMPLQGTASDIIKLAMLAVSKALKAENLNAKLILQVHDELIIDTPIEEVAKVSELLKACMENAVSLSVPLTAEVAVGNNWYDAK